MLERFITYEMADKDLPALSIALVDDQQIVWAKGFGFADAKRKVPATADHLPRSFEYSTEGRLLKKWLEKRKTIHEKIRNNSK
ncbi:MAG: serine hydrolase [Pyrinomonadaceae bacterium]